MKRTKNAPNPAALNVREMARMYLQHLEDAGKSQSTLLSYWIDLTLACRELGDETPIDALTKDQIAAFFDCDAVTKTRTGKQKSPLTVEKTRRVLRMALIWAHEQGLFEEAPVPASALAPKARAAAAVAPQEDPAKKRRRGGKTPDGTEPEAAAPVAPDEEPAPAPTHRKRRAAKPKPDAEQAEG